MTRVVILASASIACTSACGDGPFVPDYEQPKPLPNVGPYVSGAALDNLDANGHFRFSTPHVEGPYPILTPEQAREIAQGVIRTWYVNANTIGGFESLAEAAERQHGASIDWSEVRAGNREAFFAESHLEPLPSALGNPAVRNFGPFYLVPMYEGSKPVVAIGVAAYATNIFLDASGRVVRTDPLDTGGEFRAHGVPLSLNSVTLPPAPESAVEFAYNQTGTKVKSVPVLGVPGNRVVQNYARWEIVLAETVDFERVVDGQPVSADTVYIGVAPSITDQWSTNRPPFSFAPRIFVRAEQQPTTEDISGVMVPIRPGYNVHLHEVRVR